MDFRLTLAQQELQDGARRLLDDQFSTAHVREAEASADGFPRTLWDAGVEHGWSGLTQATEFGGGAHDLLDMCVLVEETGRAGATLPLVVSSGVAAAILQRSPRGALRDRLLQAITAGKIVSPALIDEQGRNEWDAVRFPLQPDGNDYRLSGKKILVPFGSVANELLVTASSEHGETAIVAIDSDVQGATVTPHHSKVGVPLSMVEFTDVLVPAERVIHRGEEAGEALYAGLQIGSLLATAESVGWCEALITITVGHVTSRQAFGRSIGTFQAVAHPCADMRVSVDAVRILVQQAAWMVDNGRNADEEIPATKALANELFERVANDAFRFHGALGFSNECDVQLFMRRLQGFFGSFGETQESFERAAEALGI